MNAYTTRGQARIQYRDIAALLTEGSWPPPLAALERQRGYQAEAEVERLLKQHGGRAANGRGTRRDAAADDRCGAGPRWRTPRGRPPEWRLRETAPAAGTLGTAG